MLVTFRHNWGNKVKNAKFISIAVILVVFVGVVWLSRNDNTGVEPAGAPEVKTSAGSAAIKSTDSGDNPAGTSASGSASAQSTPPAVPAVQTEPPAETLVDAAPVQQDTSSAPAGASSVIVRPAFRPVAATPPEINRNQTTEIPPSGPRKSLP